METIKDFFKNILQSSNERMNSPIIGTYFISFVIYNWRAILVLIFSNSSIEKRIETINVLYCNSNAIVIPAFITLLYIIVLPHLQLLLDFLLTFSQKLSYNISQSRKKRLLKGKVEEASLEREIADSRAGTSEISNLKIQVDLLKEQNDDLLKKSNTDLQSFNNQISELNNQQVSSQNLVGNLQQDVKVYKDLYDKLNNNLSYIELPKETIATLESFTYEEQTELLKLNDQNFNDGVENSNLLSKFQRAGILYHNIAGDILLTQFGKIAIKYYKKTLLPF